MSLIHKINGQLLQSLNERAGGKDSSSISNGASVSIKNDTVSLRPGLSKGADIFAFSYRGLSIATDVFEQSLTRQQDIFDTVRELKALAGDAASGQITDNERITLNQSFKSLLRKYNAQIQSQTEGDDAVDVLSISDLKKVLYDNGIDISVSNTLSDSFNNMGGKDFKLGKEPITISDKVSVSLSQLSIENQSSATMAYDALGSLEEELNKDLKNTLTTFEELYGGLQFAIYGGAAFSDAANGLLSASGADSLANAIVSNIKSNTRDNAIAAHSDVDSSLARLLLGL